MEKTPAEAIEKIPFKLESPFEPAGDQPQAIEKLVKDHGYEVVKFEAEGHMRGNLCARSAAET